MEDYENNLLWQDPGFGDIPGFSFRGESGVIHCGSNTYTLTKHAFKQWLQRGPVRMRTFPDGRADALQLLIDMVTGAKRVTRANHLKQFFKHGGKDANYLSSEGWIFVLEEGDLLKTCYYKGDINQHGYTKIAP